MFDESEMAEHESDSATWIALADLMTGLMAIFLVLCLAVMLNTNKQRILIIEGVKEALEENNIRVTTDPTTGDIGVQNKDLLFDENSAVLKEGGKDFLNTFVPAYSKAVFSLPKELSDEVVRFVVEGRTSADGSDAHNMVLSLERASSVVQYIYQMPYFDYKKEMLKKLTPVGRGENEAENTSGAVKNDRAVLFRFQFKGEMLKKENNKNTIDKVASFTEDSIISDVILDDFVSEGDIK